MDPEGDAPEDEKVGPDRDSVARRVGFALLHALLWGVGGLLIGYAGTLGAIVVTMLAMGESPRYMDQLGILPILVAPVVALVAGVVGFVRCLRSSRRGSRPTANG